MTVHRITGVAAALACALVTLSAPGLAQAAASSPAAAAGSDAAGFGETIDVRVVNLEVVVTDRDGNRVNGLAPTDFELRVDGKAVPIDYFTEVRGGTAIEPAAGGPTQGVPALAPGSPVGTNYLVFVDEDWAIQRDRNRVLESLRSQLASLAPEDRMAIVAWNGRRLEMLTSWSGDTAALDRLLRDAQARPAHGLERLAQRRNFDVDSDRRDLMHTRSGGYGFGGAQNLDVEERAYAVAVHEGVSRAVAAAVATLRSFANPVGRKVMLVLAGGWPYSPEEWAVNDRRRPIFNREVPGGPDLFRPLTDTANRVGYTVYTVDVPGLQTQLVDASDSGADLTQGGGIVRENLLRTSLDYVARQTGGRAFFAGASTGALQRAAEDTRSYYWLGFTPDRRQDDRRHEVRVKVLRKGLSVRSREDFLDISRRSEVTMAVESSLLFGNTPAARALLLTVDPPKRSARGRMRTQLDVGIPADAITLLPAGEGRLGAELDLRVAALDDHGDTAEIPVIPFRVSASAAPGPGSVLHYTTTLELRDRPHRLVVAVYDTAGTALLTATADVTPPADGK